MVDEVGGLNKAIEVTKELLKVDSNANFNIEEFPKIYSNDFSFENFNETPDLKLSSTLVPEELDKSSFIEEILPIIYSDDMLMIMPYNISVE